MGEGKALSRQGTKWLGVNKIQKEIFVMRIIRKILRKCWSKEADENGKYIIQCPHQ